MAGDHYFLELEPPEEQLRHAPQVVIVGGGFAGIQACRAFAQSEVRITLIDKRNFTLFQPLLYQVAMGVNVANWHSKPAHGSQFSRRPLPSARGGKGLPLLHQMRPCKQL